MLFNFDSLSKGGRITEDSFRFSGDYLFQVEEDGSFELALLESGTLVWLADPGLVDLCLVGAGQDGGAAFFSGGGSGNWNYNDSFINSGPGGDSGGVLTRRGIPLKGNCQVTVGTDGGDTELANGAQFFSSSAGTIRLGGTGATMRQAHNSSGTVNKGGTPGVWPYESDQEETIIQELQGHRVAASGGAGHANNNYGDGVYTDVHGGSNAGGSTDGANGGTRDHHAGYDATGYGNGGGGGYGDGSGHVNGLGGKGSHGIAMIRRHKEVPIT